MAFSLRKMFSNITYFKKSDDEKDQPHSKIRRETYVVDEPFIMYNEPSEPDSTTRQSAGLELPESVKNFTAKKGSFSDTDLLHSNFDNPLRKKRRCKKLKLDIRKASQSMNTLMNDSNIENTPKHVHLESNSSDVFSERFKGLNFNKTLNLIDAISDDQSSPFEDDFDIESLSDNSESDASARSSKLSRKMCHKASTSQSSDNKEVISSGSIESFTDIEMDPNSDHKTSILVNYQTKLEELECLLKSLLHEFQFHISVSEVFKSQSSVSTLSENIPTMLDELMHIKKKCNKQSLSSSWNVISESADNDTKHNIKKHLLSMKAFIEDFVRLNLQNNSSREIQTRSVGKCKPYVPKKLVKRRKQKSIKPFDFPDLRDAMLTLFDTDNATSQDSTIDISSSDESDMSKCTCKCHSTSSDADSGATSTVNDRSISITSSIGNFTMDFSDLTAYSESLDQTVSYNSFQDTSLYGNLMQKATIERISFYVQVHSIQLKCEQSQDDDYAKNILTFHCLPCKDVQSEENGLLRHILSQSHCEKIHFLYKTAYIKKCVAAGQEIQPSTVLNPMTMYRDDNKIVCFGDAVYACSLCFENLIVGESVLMSHCYEAQHADRREKLAEIIG